MLVGMQRSEVTCTPLAQIVGRTKTIDPALFELARVLDK